MKSIYQAHIALLIVAFIYGLNYIVAKDVMAGFLDPREFILIRVAGASILFWMTHLFFKGVSIQKKDLFRLAAAGFFGVAANQILFFEGLDLTTPINASIIMTVNPVLVMLLSAVLLRDPIRPIRVLGIVLGGTGAVLLITGGGPVNLMGSDTHLGNLLIFLNASSYAIYLVIVKPLMAKYPPIQVIKWVFLFGLMFVLPLGIPEMADTKWTSFPVRIWGSIAFVVLGTTYVAYLFNVFAMKTVTSTTVSTYIYLQPLFATVLSLWLGVDSLSPVKLMAAFLIFSGVFLVSWRRDRS